MVHRQRILGFSWTGKRLRTENRLLRQRIDYLERESSALADRLVRGQVDLAQQADACLNITHELNILRDINSEAHRRLEDAYETIRELSSEKGSIKKDKMEKGIQIDDNSMIEHIHQLQQELIEAHTKKADLEGTVREFKSRINELEFANKRLKEFPPEGKVAEIQEELIRVKMREAESSLSLKEMRQKLAEMEQQWQRFMQLREINTSQISTSHTPQSVDSSQGNMPTSSTDDEQLRESTWQSPTHQTQSLQQQQPQTARARIAKLTASIIGAAATLGGNNENGQPPSADAFEGWTHRELEDNFIGLKIREADTLAELKEMRQKIMELETQNHVSTNQLKRQDEEIRRLREEKDASVQMGQELKEKLKDCESQLVVLQSGLEEKSVMQRLKYAEAVQTVAELKQQLAQLESKRAEKELQGHIQCNLHNDSLASSTRSVTSLDGIQSFSSEEMVAFISTIKARKASTESNYGETDDGTETEANEPDSSTEISSAICHNNDIHSPVSPIITNDMANNISLAVHTETTDSGLSLNEN